MALSNWDLLVINQDGMMSNGVHRSARGIEVAFYKNWLYVSDEAAWHEHLGYSKPVLMEVQSGSMRYGDVNIRAARGSNNGIYAAVWSGIVNSATQPFNGMCGVACYAHDDDELAGISTNVLKSFSKWVRHFDAHTLPLRMRTCDFSRSYRYNQGDAYIAQTAGQPIPATLPGQSQPSLLSRFLAAHSNGDVV